jgi:MFS transporter, ACS family, D-galactonate transporter
MNVPLREPTGAISEAGLQRTGREAVPRPSWVRWRIVLLMMAFSFMSYFNRTSLPVAGVERIMPRYAIDPERMGLAYSAFLVTYTLFMVPGGYLVDRFGPKVALVAIGFGSAFCAGLTGIWGHAMLAASGSLVAIVIARGLMGIFSAPIYPASGRMLINWLPARQRALAMGMIVGSAPVAIASTYVLFGRLIERIDWPAAFVVIGVLTAALALLWIAYATDSPRAHPGVNAPERELIGEGLPTAAAIVKPPGDDPALAAHDAPASRPDARPLWQRMLTSRSVILLALSYAAVGYFEYMLFYWIQYYFETVLQMGKQESRYYAGIPPLAMAAGFPLGGWVTDLMRDVLGPRWGRSAVGMGCMLASAAALAVVPFARQPVWLVIWFSLAMGFMGASDVVFWTTSIELGGRRGGTTGGFNNFLGNLGGTIAPALSPVIAAFIDKRRHALPSLLLLFGDGWSTALAFASLLCLIGALFWIWIDPTERLA